MKRFFFIFIFSVLSFSLSAEENTQKRALVAGGAGFLGSHLCDRLIAEGYDVLCIDNLLTGFEKNIDHLQGNEHFSFLVHDVCEPISIDGPIDEIYNLACAASPIHYQNNPIHTLKTNFLGNYHLLELARTKNALYFQASTSEVYGDPLIHPQTESYFGNVNPIGIRACYDEGKRIAETLCFEYYRQYGVKIKVARIFNTYGPRMSPEDGRVVSNFIIQTLSSQPITIYGEGLQTRSFCYVSDLINGFRALMKTQDDFTGPVNLGNPEEMTIKCFASLVTSLITSSTEIAYLDLPQDDPKIRKPDISLAKEKLGWKPRVSIKEGLQLTIDYFQNEPF